MNKIIWPPLRYEDWKETYQTLHRWTQIVGKIRLSKTPWLNHSWHATLYVTERGLTTSVIHDTQAPGRSFSIQFDFISHVLRIDRSDGGPTVLPLVSESVASFNSRLTGALRDSGIETAIAGKPNELPDALPFSEDQIHCTYVPASANCFWRVLLQSDRVMKLFRSFFEGKASPVHFFWGSFDLAVTRFSGRRAPEHPGGVPHLPDLVTREAYSHEVSSCGFWPGNEQFPGAAFYSYAYPMPEGFESAQSSVAGNAYFHGILREFILPYESVVASPNPDELILGFFQSTYEAAANLGHWDRASLEETLYLKILRYQERQRHLPKTSAA
jgi:hypothetical protein